MLHRLKITWHGWYISQFLIYLFRAVCEEVAMWFLEEYLLIISTYTRNMEP